MHSVFVGGLYKYREKCKNLFSDKAAGFSVGEISHDHRIRETPSSMIPWDVMWCLSKHFKLSGPGGKGPTHQGRRRIPSLGREDPLEEEMATHSSILAWRVPWTEEPGRLHTVHGVAKSRTWLKWLVGLWGFQNWTPCLTAQIHFSRSYPHFGWWWFGPSSCWDPNQVLFTVFFLLHLTTPSSLETVNSTQNFHTSSLLSNVPHSLLYAGL